MRSSRDEIESLKTLLSQFNEAHANLMERVTSYRNNITPSIFTQTFNAIFPISTSSSINDKTHLLHASSPITHEKETLEKLNNWFTPAVENELTQLASANTTLLDTFNVEEKAREKTTNYLATLHEENNSSYQKKLIKAQETITDARTTTLKMIKEMQDNVEQHYPALDVYYRNLHKLDADNAKQEQIFITQASHLNKKNTDNRKRWQRLISMMPTKITSQPTEWINSETLVEKHLKPNLNNDWTMATQTTDTFETDMDALPSGIRSTLISVRDELQQVNHQFQSIDWGMHDQEYLKIQQSIESINSSADFDAFNDSVNEQIKSLFDDKKTATVEQIHLGIKNIEAAFDSMLNNLSIYEKQTAKTIASIETAIKKIPNIETITIKELLEKQSIQSRINLINALHHKYQNRINFLTNIQAFANNISNVRVEKLYAHLKGILSPSAFAEALNTPSAIEVSHHPHKSTLSSVELYLSVTHEGFHFAKKMTLQANHEAQALLAEIAEFSGFRRARELIQSNQPHVHHRYSPAFVIAILEPKVNTAKELTKQLEIDSQIEDWKTNANDTIAKYYSKHEQHDNITKTIESVYCIMKAFRASHPETNANDSNAYKGIISNYSRLTEIGKKLLSALKKIKNDGIIVQYQDETQKKIDESRDNFVNVFLSTHRNAFTALKKDLDELNKLKDNLDPLNTRLVKLCSDTDHRLKMEELQTTLIGFEIHSSNREKRIDDITQQIRLNIQSSITFFNTTSSQIDKQQLPSMDEIETQWLNQSLGAFKALLKTHHTLDQEEYAIANKCQAWTKAYHPNFAQLEELLVIGNAIVHFNKEYNLAAKLYEKKTLILKKRYEILLEKQRSKSGVIQSIKSILKNIRAETLTVLRAINFNDIADTQTAFIGLKNLLSKHSNTWRSIKTMCNAKDISNEEMQHAQQWLSAFTIAGNAFNQTPSSSENTSIPLTRLNSTTFHLVSYIHSMPTHQQNCQTEIRKKVETAHKFISTEIESILDPIYEIQNNTDRAHAAIREARRSNLHKMKEYNANKLKLAAHIESYTNRLVLPKYNLPSQPLINDENNTPDITQYESLKSTYRQHINTFQFILEQLNTLDNENKIDTLLPGIEKLKIRIGEEEKLLLDKTTEQNVSFIKKLKQKREKLNASIQKRSQALSMFASSFTKNFTLETIVGEINDVQKKHDEVLTFAQIPYPLQPDSQALSELKNQVSLVIRKLNNAVQIIELHFSSLLNELNLQSYKDMSRTTFLDLLKKVILTIKLVKKPLQNSKEPVAEMINLIKKCNLNEDILLRFVDSVIEDSYSTTHRACEKQKNELWNAFMSKKEIFDSFYSWSFIMLSNIEQLELPWVSMQPLFTDTLNRFEQWNNQFALPFLAEYERFKSEIDLLARLDKEITALETDFGEVTLLQQDCDSLSAKTAAMYTAIIQHKLNANKLADEQAIFTTEKAAFQNRNWSRVNGNIFQRFKYVFLNDAEVMSALIALGKHAIDHKKLDKKNAIFAFIKALNECNTNLLDLTNIIDGTLESFLLTFSDEKISLRTTSGKNTTKTFALIKPLQSRLHALIDAWIINTPTVDLEKTFESRKQHLNTFFHLPLQTVSTPTFLAAFHYEQIIGMLNRVHTHQDTASLAGELKAINDNNDDDFKKITAFRQKINDVCEKITKNRNGNHLNWLKILSNGSNLGNELKKCLITLDLALASFNKLALQ